MEFLSKITVEDIAVTLLVLLWNGYLIYKMRKDARTNSDAKGSNRL